MNSINNEYLTETFLTTNIIGSVFDLIVTLLVVVIIWLVGNWVLSIILRVATKINIPGTQIDDKIIDRFRPLINIVWKILLIIVILEYVGVGGFIINAFLGVISFTIAIALGLSIGDALKPYAKDMVENIVKGQKK